MKNALSHFSFSKAFSSKMDRTTIPMDEHLAVAQRFSDTSRPALGYCAAFVSRCYLTERKNLLFFTALRVQCDFSFL